MAALSAADREEILAKINRDFSTLRESTSLTKPDFRAALAAIDAWIDANSTSYNNAIPQPARGALTPKQKAMLLMSVMIRRWEVL